MLAIDMTTSPAAATFEIALHTFISRSIQAMRKSTMPRSALAEPLRYAQSARLGRVPMGCGPAYAAGTQISLSVTRTVDGETYVSPEAKAVLG